MPDSGSVKVLVVPVFKRYWLFHAWKTKAPPGAPPKPWQQGSSLGEQLQLLLGAVQRWGIKQGEQQWQKITTAPKGTFNHKLHWYVVSHLAAACGHCCSCMYASTHPPCCRSLPHLD